MSIHSVYASLIIIEAKCVFIKFIFLLQDQILVILFFPSLKCSNKILSSNTASPAKLQTLHLKLSILLHTEVE